MQLRALVRICILCTTVPFLSFSQDSFKKRASWGISGSFGSSSSRLPRGVSNVYAGPPFFSDDLVITTKPVESFAFKIIREKKLKNRLVRFISENSLGFMTMGFIRNYDYDYASSINNIVKIDRRFSYLTFAQKLKYEISLSEKFSLIPAAGLFVGKLLTSKEKDTNYYNGDFITVQRNILSYEKKYNTGFELSLAGRVKFLKFDLDVRPYYNSFFRAHYGDRQEKIFTYGASVILFLKFS